MARSTTSFTAMTIFMLLLVSLPFGYAKAGYSTGSALSVHPNALPSGHGQVLNQDIDPDLQQAPPLSETSLATIKKRFVPVSSNPSGQCQSLLMQTILPIHTVNWLTNFFCVAGPLCMLTPYTQAYSLIDQDSFYDKYMKGGPDPCESADGVCEMYNNRTAGKLKAIYRCDCLATLVFLRFFKEDVILDGKTYKCDLDSIAIRFKAKGLKAPTVLQSNVACEGTKDPNVCICNLNDGLPSNIHNETCYTLWNITDGPGSAH